MYFVHYKSVFGVNMCKVNTLGEAKDIVTQLAEQGHQEIYVSQEIPIKVKVEVEF